MTMKINGLPVRDAKRHLQLDITAGDIKRGNPKNPSSCAAARAVLRSMPECAAARIHLGRSYINTGKYWLRYLTGQPLRSEIIALDRGGSFSPGHYTLAPMTPSHKSTGKRQGSSVETAAAKKKKKPTKKRTIDVISGVRQHGSSGSTITPHRKEIA